MFHKRYSIENEPYRTNLLYLTTLPVTTKDLIVFLEVYLNNFSVNEIYF